MEHSPPRRFHLNAPLEALARIPVNIPTLAEIVTALRLTNKPRLTTLSQQEFWELTYAESDRLYGGRFDYRLWRLVACPQLQPQSLRHWGQISAVASSGLANGHETEVWGIFQLIAREITKPIKSRRILEPHLKDIASSCYARLHGSLKIVKGARAGCAFAQIMLLDALQSYFHSGIGAAVTLEEAAKHASDIERLFKQVDPSWSLESSALNAPSLVSIDREMESYVAALLSLERETTTALGPGRMVALDHAPDIFHVLACCLYRVRGKIVVGCKNSDVPISLLQHHLVRAERFARCAWLAARGGRLVSTSSSEEVKTQLLTFEYRALLRNAQALLDSGDCLGSAALNARLLWLLPEERAYGKDFANIHLQLFNSIYQAGYEVPNWARGRTKDENGQLVRVPLKRAVQANRNAGLSNAMSDSVSVTGDSAAAAMESFPEDVEAPFEVIPSKAETTGRQRKMGSNLNDRRIEEGFKTDARWTAVLAADPALVPDKITASQGRRLVAYIAQHSNNFSGQQDLLRASFSICLETGALRHASWILENLAVTTEDILNFATRIRRATQLLPALMEVRQYNKWQKRLADALARLPKAQADAMTEGQTLLLHEMLTGRCITIIRGSSKTVRQLYLDKFDDKASSNALFRALDQKLDPDIKTVGTVAPYSLCNFNRQGNSNGIGEPTLLSLVDLGNDYFSLLARKPNGSWVKQTLCINGFMQAAKALLAFQRVWYSPAEASVPWPQQFRELASSLCACLELPTDGANWILAAVSPNLAAFPLQDLFHRHVSSTAVLSLVPNFSWADLEFHRKALWLESVFKLGTDDICSAARKTIDQNRAGLDGAGVVLGHGQWSEGHFTSVELGNAALTPDDWLNLAEHRVCIVHSCWGGCTEERLLGDLGGLPWNAFALGCRFFCAPVCEVSPETASVLHRHLTAKSEPSEMGLRYLNAIQEDPAVSLYTLYGFADEPAKMF